MSLNENIFLLLQDVIIFCHPSLTFENFTFFVKFPFIISSFLTLKGKSPFLSTFSVTSIYFSWQYSTMLDLCDRLVQSALSFDVHLITKGPSVASAISSVFGLSLFWCTRWIDLFQRLCVRYPLFYANVHTVENPSATWARELRSGLSLSITQLSSHGSPWENTICCDWWKITVH